MGERNLKLVADNKPRKRHILLLFACLAVVLGMGIYFLITDFSIQKIQISGNNTYTNAEIIEAMKEDGYIDNTLLMIAQNQIFDQTYLPFIEKVSMSYDDSHILKVKVKEKLRTGVFKYMNEYVYFNENGIAMESRNTLFEGVPVVTGVKFNEMNLKRKILENKVPVKKNYFNTPMGNYKSPLICDVPTLNACYKFLNDKNVAIYNQDYASLLDMIPDNSFVYLDPPYFPVSKTANFTSYQSDKFKETEQFRLLDFCMNLHKRRIRFLLSNSDVPEAREIYSKFNIKVLEVCRRINSNITKRSAVNELAVTNYDVATGELLKID